MLGAAGRRLLALEVNGLRSPCENRSTIALAREADAGAAGGDRHGREPSGVLNRTNATTFGGFAAEVRPGCSHVLLLDPSRRRRVPQNTVDILATPALSARVDSLRDFVVYRDPEDRVHSLATLWGASTLVSELSMPLESRRSPQAVEVL